METISAAYRDRIVQMMGRAKLGRTVSEHNVYQIANLEILPFIDSMVRDLAQEESKILGIENLWALLEKAKAGASCLLLLEHYSNFDLPVFNYLLRHTVEGGQELADAVVAMAGMKLNESNPVVSAFTEGYTRIVIYPSRSLKDLDPQKDREELIRSNAINRAAMKALNEVKKSGKLVLVFPAGTRFRPWDPQSTRGVREIDSYIKSFDYMCMVAVNGEVLCIQKGDMAEDVVCKDVVQFTVDPVVSCAEFREAERARAEKAGIEDKKQAVVDAIMERLKVIHREAEAKRPKANRT